MRTTELTAQEERIVAYVKVSKEIITGTDGDDYIRDTLTTMLYGTILTAAKESGEIDVYVKPPSFLDWLLRRNKTIKVPYTIRQLMKKGLMPGSLPIIEFDQHIEDSASELIDPIL